MNRRQFCRNAIGLGGVLALAPWLDACGETAPAATPTPAPPTATPSPAATPAATATAASTATRDPSPTATTQPTDTPSPTATAAAGMAAVALASTTDRAAGVRQALDLFGANPVRGRHVLVKPNYNSADEAPGSTHPDTLRTLLASLTDMGARSLTLADRSGMGATPQVLAQRGVFDLAKSFGARVVVLDELAADAWDMANGDGWHWSRGFPIPKLLAEAECVVQTCNLKTHRFGGHFTLSLKNSVGFAGKNVKGYNYMNELHGSPDQRRMIAEINTTYAPALVVLDGVQAFVKGGPDKGVVAATGVVMAGADRVAIDAAGVAVLRLFGTTPEVSRGKVFAQEQIVRAVELGLGVGTPDKIAFVTGDEEGRAYAERIREVLLT